MNTFEIKFDNRLPEASKTKFGGQPDWVTEPEWPISKETGRPMRFVCQINLAEIGLDENEAKFAYFFMTEEDDYAGVDTWDPDGGENAIILQPGDNIVHTECLAQGPTIYEMVRSADQTRMVPKDFSCAVNLDVLKNPVNDTSEEFEIKNKIGGVPDFIQGEDYPSSEEWDLLFQLNSNEVPFFINFGDSGIGYAFITKNRKNAKFLWQGY